MNREIQRGDSLMADEYPAFVIWEKGINHTGNNGLARKLVDLVVA